MTTGRPRRAAPKAQRLSILVSGASPALAARLRKAARYALTSEKIRRGRLEIAVIDKHDMRRCHKDWLGRAKITDVLTFDLRDRAERKDRRLVSGQVLVCKDVARAAAAQRRLPAHAELALYVVHGCLHLCGYDDLREHDAERMHAREDQLLVRLGFGKVFQPLAVRRRSSGRRPRQPTHP